MTNLRILYAWGDCGIEDDSLIGLNLVELNVSYNPKIKKINHMTNLKKLNASQNSGIEDDSLIGLNLVELSVNWNSKIKNINHMTNLRILGIHRDHHLIYHQMDPQLSFLVKVKY